MATKIEKLDLRFPGLADQVRAWFNLGRTAQEVSQLLREQYHVSVPLWTVSRFRAHRWARERDLREAQEAEAAARAHFSRLLEMKAASGANFQGAEK